MKGEIKMAQIGMTKGAWCSKCRAEATVNCWSCGCQTLSFQESFNRGHREHCPNKEFFEKFLKNCGQKDHPVLHLPRYGP